MNREKFKQHREIKSTQKRNKEKQRIGVRNGNKIKGTNEQRD